MKSIISYEIDGIAVSDLSPEGEFAQAGYAVLLAGATELAKHPIFRDRLAAGDVVAKNYIEFDLPLNVSDFPEEPAPET